MAFVQVLLLLASTAQAQRSFEFSIAED